MGERIIVELMNFLFLRTWFLSPPSVDALKGQSWLKYGSEVERRGMKESRKEDGCREQRKLTRIVQKKSFLLLPFLNTGITNVSIYKRVISKCVKGLKE